MLPEEYEKYVAEYFIKNGYQVELTSFTNDYGVDIFAIKNSLKCAVQVKMFGNTARKINRKMVMELHGAKDYFDCNYAKIVTDGEILQDAKQVAEKLNIELIYLPVNSVTNANNETDMNFDLIWQKYIMPLQGKTLFRENGEKNVITKVNWGGIERITSNQKSQKIDIEIFKQTINHLLRYGSITRKKINEEYSKRASSGIVLILSQVPFIELDLNRPMSLKLIK
jgi:hypothetical protein